MLINLWQTILFAGASKLFSPCYVISVSIANQQQSTNPCILSNLDQSVQISSTEIEVVATEFRQIIIIYCDFSNW